MSMSNFFDAVGWITTGNIYGEVSIAPAGARAF